MSEGDRRPYPASMSDQPHRPRMPAERVEQIRRWHERVYRDEAGFDRTVVAERSQTKDGWTVDYLTFRMTPRPEWTTE